MINFTALFSWFLGISTLLVNSGLGWARGAWWVWGLHFINALLWNVYVIATKQYGFVLLNTITMIVDLVSGYRAWRSR